MVKFKIKNKKSLAWLVRKIIFRTPDYAYYIFCRLPLGWFRSKKTLKNAYKDKFLIGAGIDVSTFYNTDRRQLKVLRRHFNAVSPTFCFKIPILAGQYGEGKIAAFDVRMADKFVKFARRNKLEIMGHCLISGILIPKGWYTDGQNNDVSAELLLEIMKTHINSLAGRYKGKIHSWDAANEILNNQGNYLRNLYYNTLGEDYMKYIFQF
ncbi:MAG: endo-1,4-beta-xylanase, partial [Paludibacter sp.]|nr:endo-1,4-beta-xylanase [Paludibacter sp.]